MEAQVRGIILLTGVMAAGKSTIAQHLAERLPMSVHLRGDVFRRMFVDGRAEMGPGFTESAWEQLRLRYRLATASAQTGRLVEARRSSRPTWSPPRTCLCLPLPASACLCLAMSWWAATTSSTSHRVSSARGNA
jgi:hypothetical protein